MWSRETWSCERDSEWCDRDCGTVGPGEGDEAWVDERDADLSDPIDPNGGAGARRWRSYSTGSHAGNALLDPCESVVGLLECVSGDGKGADVWDLDRRWLLSPSPLPSPSPSPSLGECEWWCRWCRRCRWWRPRRSWL